MANVRRAGATFARGRWARARKGGDAAVARMKTLQGIETRRALVRRLIVRVALYTGAFAVLMASARLLVGDALSELIADATSTWMDVPAESADLYRMLGYQEGMSVDGSVTFRDLSDYRFVVGIIKGPLLWSVYAAGLVATAALTAADAAEDVDVLTRAIEQMAEGADVPALPDGLASARRELELLGERQGRQVRAALAAEERKDELVAYLAHDIRTPLTSIVGYLALLAEEPDLPEERRCRYAATALARARELDGMMGEFFEITRYNLGAIPIERERIDARLLMEQVADELLPQAAERSVALEVEAPAGIEAFVDPRQMARALSNIVRNGIAFADRGSTVACAVGCAGGDVTFTVTDTGREIAPEHLRRIFERFYREDASRGPGGAGLGLAIAREIVEAHGGRVDARSERGVTSFTVCVPGSRAPDPSLDGDVAGQAPGRP